MSELKIPHEYTNARTWREVKDDVNRDMECLRKKALEEITNLDKIKYFLAAPLWRVTLSGGNNFCDVCGELFPLHHECR